MKADKSVQVVRIGQRKQIVPSDEAQIHKLERYLSVMPRTHPKRAMYYKKLKQLLQD